MKSSSVIRSAGVSPGARLQPGGGAHPGAAVEVLVVGAGRVRVQVGVPGFRRLGICGAVVQEGRMTRMMMMTTTTGPTSITREERRGECLLRMTAMGRVGLNALGKQRWG